MIVPSKLEAFGQTASEAHACGTPVVAFGATGLKDIIDHKITGFLVDSFDSISLAKGIDWVLRDDDRGEKLSRNSRQKAEKTWDYGIVANQYITLYEKCINSF